MAFLIYLIGVLGCLKIVLLFTALGCFISALFVKLSAYDNGEESPPHFKKILKAGLILMSLLVFIPSSKIVSAMILLPKIVNNEKIIGISEKSLDLLNANLDEWLKEVTKQKGE